jgi:hypothetical protein
MMSDKMALKVAIDLLHVPSQVRLVRSAPLPDGVVALLRIAAGDAEAEDAAAALTDRPHDVVRRAAAFFIEQILFAPHADSYRVLGASPQATAGELRRNVAFLLRWLHPDLDPQGERAIFIGRVTAAWNDLKTAERRAAYDKARWTVKDGSRSRPKVRRAVFRWGGSKKPAAAVRPYPGGDVTRLQSIYAPGKGSFLRRALSALFHPQPH